MFKGAQPTRKSLPASKPLLSIATRLTTPASALTLVLLASTAPLPGQALPPTAPTLPSAVAPSGPPPAQANPSQTARVAYSAGRLQVTAENSSLNQILREIGRVTGMKITGGVAEERVFGSYGPADPSSVLYALLDGTGSNMILRFNSARKPEELVLTPRQGGVTPPSPNASRYANREDDLPPDRRLGLRSQPFTPGPSPAYTQNPASTPQQPAAQGTPGSPSPAPGTTTQQSPNGVKTPQEIYDQLMKMQQQQPKPPQ